MSRCMNASSVDMHSSTTVNRLLRSDGLKRDSTNKIHGLIPLARLLSSIANSQSSIPQDPVPFPQYFLPAA